MPDDRATDEDAGTICKWVPVVDGGRCTGCSRCVEACVPGSLAIRGGLAILACADTCGSEGHCVAACEDGAIRMDWVPCRGDPALGRWGA